MVPLSGVGIDYGGNIHVINYLHMVALYACKVHEIFVVNPCMSDNCYTNCCFPNGMLIIIMNV